MSTNPYDFDGDAREEEAQAEKYLAELHAEMKLLDAVCDSLEAALETALPEMRSESLAKAKAALTLSKGVRRG